MVRHFQRHFARKCSNVLSITDILSREWCTAIEGARWAQASQKEPMWLVSLKTKSISNNSYHFRCLQLGHSSYNCQKRLLVAKKLWFHRKYNHCIWPLFPLSWSQCVNRGGGSFFWANGPHDPNSPKGHCLGKWPKRPKPISQDVSHLDPGWIHLDPPVWGTQGCLWPKPPNYGHIWAVLGQKWP